MPRPLGPRRPTDRSAHPSGVRPTTGKEGRGTDREPLAPFPT
jgi:hypothetical protein